MLFDMASKQHIEFKTPGSIISGLDTALKKEQEKYNKCPVVHDRNPDYEITQGWGFVIAGYFLAEISFKALLNIRKKAVPKEHLLYLLFNSFDEDDKRILREYYSDYQATIGGQIGRFPIMNLDGFLKNLDGDKNKGSFEWRYYLIEKSENRFMPLVSVDYLHEIIFGCNRIFQHAEFKTSEPSEWLYSRRTKRFGVSGR